MHLSVQTVSSKDEGLPRFLGASDELASRFQGIVMAHLHTLGRHPMRNCATFLILASPTPDFPPIGFHYFYTYSDSDNEICCELWAVFVEKAYERQGIAFDLIRKAIAEVDSKGAKTFVFRFIAPNAHEGKLVSRLRRLGREKYPTKLFAQLGADCLLPL